MIFLDTSILIGGVIASPHGSEQARKILLASRPYATGWHCCLEFYSVLTRLPPEQRIPPEDALLLLEEYVFGRIQILQLPKNRMRTFLRKSALENVQGGRLYDAHIAEIACAHRVDMVVTENPRHFLLLLRAGIPVLRASEFLESSRE